MSGILSYYAISVVSLIALAYPSLRKFFPPPVQNVGDLIAGVVKEVFVIPVILSGMIYQKVFGKEKESLDQKGDPVLLSNGYLGSSGQMFYLKNNLKKNKAVFTMDYADPLASIDDFAWEMHKKIEEIKQYYPGKKLTLIGHSMGGIISARYVANCENIDHIEKIITLGSPLQGTYFAHVTFGKCAKEMRRHSDYLNRLEQDLLGKNISFINICSRSDLIVLPNSAAAFKSVPSEKIIFGSMGHMTYLCSDRIVDYIKACLK